MPIQKGAAGLQAGGLVPESCMKIDEKLFYFLIQKDLGKI